MIERTEKFLTSQEVTNILAEHFGFPRGQCELWFKGEREVYILRRDEPDLEVPPKEKPEHDGWGMEEVLEYVTKILRGTKRDPDFLTIVLGTIRGRIMTALKAEGKKIP